MADEPTIPAPCATSTDPNDWRCGDLDSSVRRKILNRLKEIGALLGNPPPVEVTLEPGDIEIGAVEIKDSGSNNRAAVSPSGCLSVDVCAFPVVQPVSGTVSVDNFPSALSVTDGGVEATALRVTIANDSTGLLSVDDNGGSLTVDTPQLPAALVGGRLDINVGAWLGSTAPTVGQKTMADSIPVTIASDQSAIPISGTVAVSNFPAALSVTGGGVEAAALRVTIANDSTGLLSVDDNGGSLTVDTPQLPAALVSGRLDINVGAWLGSTAPTVGQKTMAASIPVAIASDQSAIPISGSVSITGSVAVTNAGTFAVQDSQVLTDNGAFTDGTSKLFMAGFIFDETAGTALTENDAAAARVDSKRAVIGVIEDATTRGQRLTITAANAAKVDGSAVTQPISSTQLPAALVGARLDVNVGAWLGSTAPTVGQKTMANSVPVTLASDQSSLAVTATNAGTFAVQDSQVLTDNGAFTDGTSKLFMSGFIFDEVAGTALTENDAAAARVDSKRAVVGVIEDETTRGRRLTITAANAAKVDGSAVNQPVLGTKTNNNAAPGATNIGALPALANAAAPSWTEGNLVLASADLSGNIRTINPVQLPAALVGARLDVNIGAWLGSTAPTVGQKTMANSVPVVIASDQASIPVANTPTIYSGKTVNRFVLSQVGTAGTTQIAAADATKKHKVVGVVLTMSLAGTVKFTATADLTGAMDVATQGGFVIPPNVDVPWIETPVNQALSIVTTLGGANGVILYITEA